MWHQVYTKAPEKLYSMWWADGSPKLHYRTTNRLLKKSKWDFTSTLEDSNLKQIIENKCTEKRLSYWTEIPQWATMRLLSSGVYKCTWRMRGKEPWETAELQSRELSRTPLFTCWVKERDILYIHSSSTVGSRHKPAAAVVYLLAVAKGKEILGCFAKVLNTFKKWNKIKTHLPNSSTGGAGSKNSFSSSLLLSKSQHSCICFKLSMR